MRAPRYTTYTDEQLAATVRQIAPDSATDAALVAVQLRQGAATGRTRGSLLKSHSCRVTYPDGATGVCDYVRFGPSWHQFSFRHEGRSGGICPISPCSLPRQYHSQALANTPEGIAAKAQELAAAAYAAAIRAEQKDRFRRAQPPYRSSMDGVVPQMNAKRAKEIGGRYALCHRLGANLLPSSVLFETIDEAVKEWRDRGAQSLVVGCACRWSRRWEMPRFNPLYGDTDYGQPVASIQQVGQQ